jgi:hypothetical protein
MCVARVLIVMGGALCCSGMIGGGLVGVGVMMLGEDGWVLCSGGAGISVVEAGQPAGSVGLGSRVSSCCCRQKPQNAGLPGLIS